MKELIQIVAEDFCFDCLTTEKWACCLEVFLFTNLSAMCPNSGTEDDKK